MKRRDLLRHLRQQGCRFAREGAKHSIWENPATRHRTSVPRHREIPDEPPRFSTVDRNVEATVVADDDVV